MITNKEIYQRDPLKTHLLNNGVAEVRDLKTDNDIQTLRFELEHFVCEGEYQRGLVRILESYTSNIGQPEQPAAWVSGFFGSGKSHLVKMLRYLWIDYPFQDGATARGLAHLPADVLDLFKEISTLGKRQHGLHAASGMLGAGADESVRLTFLSIIFKSAGLPEHYPYARFCIWLKRNDLYDKVRKTIESEGRDFRKELNDFYVSPLITRALLVAAPDFATDEKKARELLKEQFPRQDDITNDEFIDAVQDALAEAGEFPCTVVVLDEVQQYIGEDTSRSYVVQEVVEACSKRFGDRLLFVGTGQTALSGTPALQRLHGRFKVNVELSDHDVETVTRRFVLAKRADRVKDIAGMLEENAGEIDRHLNGTKIAPRSEDQNIIIDDYPLLPTRRRFWEKVLRAVDPAGTVGQLRTQLRIIYDAIRKTADLPVGNVVPADFLFFDQSSELRQSRVLLREIHDIIQNEDDGTSEGNLRSRLCALVFLIRKLPRDPGVDIGVRPTAEMLADLLVEDLTADSTQLRTDVKDQLDNLIGRGVVIKLADGYSLQTRESSEWETEFRNRENKILNDPSQMASQRSRLLADVIQKQIGGLKLTHGKCKEPRKVSLHFGSDAPTPTGHEIPVWVRDGWGIEEKTALSDARAFGIDSPILTVFVPSQADALRKLIAETVASRDTLDFKGIPIPDEGKEARQAMQTRHANAESRLQLLVAEIVEKCRVIQGGGNEQHGMFPQQKVEGAALASLDRLFPDFKDADDSRWDNVIERARKGDDHPLEAIEFKGKTEDHPVCSAALSFIGSGKKGKVIRDYFSETPYGWPRDAVNAALICLHATGHLRATLNGVPMKVGQLDQVKVSSTDFRVEITTIETKQRLELRRLYQLLDISCRPSEEPVAAAQFLQTLLDIAKKVGGEAPLPAQPKTDHIKQLQSLSGNEQLLAIYDKRAEIEANIKEWKKASQFAAERIPEFNRLNALMMHADGQDFAAEIKSQFAAIVNDRTLLNETNPLPDLTKALVEGLRKAIETREATYNKTFDSEIAALEKVENWQKLKKAQQKSILEALGLVKVSKGAVGTDDEVLESLNRISLESWATRNAALPQQFVEARKEADKLIEPEVQYVRLSSGTLRTEKDVKEWVDESQKTLLKKLKDGPVVVS